jgi:quinol monooxygenase YgiN
MEELIFVWARFHVPAKARDAFAATFRKAAAAAVKEPGVKGYGGGFDLNDPELFISAATYESEEAFTKHQESHTTMACATELHHHMNNGVKLLGAATFGTFKRNVYDVMNRAKAHAGKSS